MRPGPRMLAMAAWAALLAPGPAGAYFEDTAVGARGVALGGGSALIEDGTSFYWNPAALAGLRRAEAVADV